MDNLLKEVTDRMAAEDGIRESLETLLEMMRGKSLLQELQDNIKYLFEGPKD